LGYRASWLAIIMGLMLVSPVTAGPLELPDRARQGDLLLGQAPPDSVIRHDDYHLRVGDRGRFVVGLDRDAPSKIEVHIQRPSGEEVQRTIRVAERDYDIQRIDGLDEDKVSPRSEATLARIHREAEQVSEARQRNEPRTDYLSGWQWPVTGRISGVYGSQRILNGEPRQPHYGVDIAVAKGTPVRAPADGVVSLVHEDMFFSGGTLMLDHGQGLSSTFLHLSRIDVSQGDSVARGDVIAAVGASGRATGPHLDWRVSWFDRRLDPTQFVDAMPERGE